MKNLQKGFVIPLLLVIIALLLAGGGTYVYTQQKSASQPVVVDQDTQSTESSNVSTCTQGRTENPPVDLPPVITSLSSSSGPIGSVLEIRGCNLSSFEGDLEVTFENSDGKKIILTDKSGSYSKTVDTLIKVVVKEPCAQGETVYGLYSGIPGVCNYMPFTPGTYKVYTTPWGKKSNEVSFTVTN